MGGWCSVARWAGLAAAMCLACGPRTPSPEAAIGSTAASYTRLVPQVGHSVPLTAMAAAPDGARVVTASNDGLALVWDATIGTVVHHLEGHTGAITAVAFSPDGADVLTASQDGTVIVWSAATGDLVRRLARHSRGVTTAAFSPDGTRVLSGSLDGTAILWDRRTGKPLDELEGHERGITSAAFSPDGAAVATGSDDGTAILWSAERGRAVHVLTGHDRGVGQVAFSADGARLLTASGDGTAALWDVATGERLLHLAGHELRVAAAAFSPDGAQIVTASDDGSAVVWDAGTGRIVHRLTPGGPPTALTSVAVGAGWVATADTHGEVVVWDAAGALLGGRGRGGARFVTVAPDGALAIAGIDGTLTLIDAVTGEVRSSLEGHAKRVNGAKLAPDGRHVLVAGGDGAAVVWDLAAGTMAQRIEAHVPWTLDVAYGPDGRAASAGGDGTWVSFDPATGERLRRVEAHGGATASIAFSPDGVRILTAGDRTAALWNAADGTLVHRFVGHDGSVYGAWFSSDGARIVTASWDRTAGVWDTASGRLVHRLTHEQPLVAATFSPKGDVVATASMDGTAALWDTATGVERFRLRGHTAAVVSVVFAPDGARLATASADGTAAVWDAVTGALLGKMAGGHGAVLRTAFSPDGVQLATGSRDGMVALWDVATGALLHRLVGHGSAITSIGFSGDGAWLVTASLDSTTRLWDVASGKLLATLLSFTDGTWAVVDEAGRYDASNDGDVNGLAWVIDGEPYGLTQLKSRYYDPGLLAKALGLRDQPLRQVPPLGQTKPPARVRLAGPDANGRTEVRLEDRGGGIGTVFATLNGSDVSKALSTACPDLRGGQTCVFDLATLPTWLTGAANRLEITVGNADDTVTARGLDVAVAAAGPALTTPVDLWILSVGTSDYASDDLDLKYAAADAVQIAKALKIAGEQGFGREHTFVRVLATGQSPETRPTRDVLDEAFRWLQGADQRDTVVVFFAGHGKAYNDGRIDDYFYLLPDAASFDDLREPDLRDLRAFSGQELAAALSELRAHKRVVVLDTCESGKADAALSTHRELSSDAIRAHVQARDRTGAWFLAGAAADRPSYEATRFGQGVLTYTLLEAMIGPALEADQVQVGRWFEYAENQVPLYAQGIGGVQAPFVRRGEGSFPLGAVPPAVRGQIPVGKARAVVVKALIVGSGGRPDKARLGSILDQKLREIADAYDLRGTDSPSSLPKAPIAVFDTDEFPGACQITGQYSEDADSIDFEGYLTQSGAQEIPLRVSGADANAVADAIVRRLAQEVAKAAR